MARNTPLFLINSLSHDHERSQSKKKSQLTEGNREVQGSCVLNNELTPTLSHSLRTSCYTRK